MMGLNGTHRTTSKQPFIENLKHNNSKVRTNEQKKIKKHQGDKGTVSEHRNHPKSQTKPQPNKNKHKLITKISGFSKNHTFTLTFFGTYETAFDMH